MVSCGRINPSFKFELLYANIMMVFGFIYNFINLSRLVATTRSYHKTCIGILSNRMITPNMSPIPLVVRALFADAYSRGGFFTIIGLHK